MKAIDRRLTELESSCDRSVRAVQIAYMLEDGESVGKQSGIWLDGQCYTVDEFRRRYPRANLTQIKVYRGFDPDNL